MEGETPDGEVTIFLIDDNPAFLRAAVRLLRRIPGSRIVGRATSFEEAEPRLELARPALVVVDLVMPGTNGLEATRRIRAGAEPPRVAIVTLHDEDEYREAARRAGADAFIPKAELGPALRRLVAEMAPSHHAGEADVR